MVQMFKEGGPVMFLLVFIAMPVLMFSVVQIFVGGRKVRVLAALVALVPAGVGLLGMVSGRTATESASHNVPADQQAALMQQGYAEASRPMQLGGGITAVCLPLLAIGFLRKRTTPSS